MFANKEYSHISVFSNFSFRLLRKLVSSLHKPAVFFLKKQNLPSLDPTNIANAGATGLERSGWCDIENAVDLEATSILPDERSRPKPALTVKFGQYTDKNLASHNAPPFIYIANIRSCSLYDARKKIQEAGQGDKSKMQCPMSIYSKTLFIWLQFNVVR